MRILVDLQGAQNGSRDRGIGRYARSIAHAIAREAGQHEILFLLNGMFPEHIESVIAHFEGVASRDQFIVFQGVGPVDELNPDNRWRLGASELLYERMVEALNPDAVLITSLFEGAMDDTVVSIGRLFRNHVVAVILYDLIPLSDPARFISYPPAAAWYYRRIEMLKRTDRMLSISHSAGDEAIGHLAVVPPRVQRIGAAASGSFRPANNAKGATSRKNAELLARLGVTRPYVMHTSAFEERKNFEGLVRAYARIPKTIRSARQLVLVCKVSDEDRERMGDLAKAEGLLSGEVVLTGHVTDVELIALYQSAELFVFPTFHEGFGLPALEAMSCGAPTLGSNASSIPEVIGWDEAMFDPHDVNDMAQLIERALTDSEFRQALTANAARQAASFSWEATARAATHSIEEAHRERRQSCSQYRAPLPIAEFARLLAEVPHEGDIPEQDLTEAAVALAANEAAARSVGASAGEKPLTWRIEGPFDSSYSLALVNRETARALDALGHHVVLHSTEGPGDFPADPAFLAKNADIAEMHAREPVISQRRADATSRNLYPPRVEDFDTPIALMHSYGWEETGFPAEWVEQFNQHLTLLTVMSRHVRKLMIDNGVSVPIIVSGIGVDHWDRVEATPGGGLSARSFRFLHVSSGFPRKGVDVLLEAYGRAFSARDDVTLIIKTFDNPHNEVAAMVETHRRNRPDYPDVMLIVADLEPGALKALYEECHVLVAPSMAEGYGLPVAEAMLSGLPAITTGWSGQLDFANESNAWLVDYQFERVRSHFGLFSSAWARADTKDLARAMRDAATRRPEDLREMADIGRAQLLADHRWSDVASRLVEAVRGATNRERDPVPRIGWLTTWNERCGIAIYSRHLIDHLDGEVTVLANRIDDPIAPYEDNHDCCWVATKDEGGLALVPAKLIEHGIQVLIIQFNYGFFHHGELASLIDRATRDGIAIVMIMHSTVDPIREIPGAELFRIVESLARCDRLLVHSIADLNRLKAIGLIDNVALFPHGALIPTQPTVKPRSKEALPLVATYGFCLPHKGLAETIDAVAVLKDRGNPVRLRMINAEFPAPLSAELVASLRRRIQHHGLDDLVEFDARFHEDAITLDMLAEADLIVFGYQNTGESASGAVRYGLAAQRPVAVTPLAIFDDLGDAVFRFDGANRVAIADGIERFLADAKADTDAARTQAEAAARWRAQHDYRIVAKRLRNICYALAADRRFDPMRLQPSSTRFTSEVGKVEGTNIRASGRAGLLLDGPGVSLAAGDYYVTIHGQMGDCSTQSGTIEIVDEDETMLARGALTRSDREQLGSIPLLLKGRCRRLSVRVNVPEGSDLLITELIIAPAPRNAVVDGRAATGRLSRMAAS